jgi:hypothetical protein
MYRGGSGQVSCGKVADYCVTEVFTNPKRGAIVITLFPRVYCKITMHKAFVNTALLAKRDCLYFLYIV